VATDHFSGWIAKNYAELWPHLFEPAVVDPAVNFLFDLAYQHAQRPRDEAIARALDVLLAEPAEVLPHRSGAVMAAPGA
jgi:hypothetical protein